MRSDQYKEMKESFINSIKDAKIGEQLEKSLKDAFVPTGKIIGEVLNNFMSH